ncbi:hypothetical protein JXA59_00175 [Patescibacteria group bacterium]|nr:hypothetical protein [Patescibacteria group bacterium]
MADDIRQWDVGGSSGNQGGGGESGDDSGDDRKKQEEKKSPGERAKEAKEKFDKTRKNLKRARDEIKKAPKRVKQAKDAIRKTGEAVKKGAKALGKGVEAVKKGADAARPAVEAGRRASMQTAARISQIAARVAAEVAAKVAAKAAQVGSKVVQAAVKLLTNPYVLGAVILILLIFLLFQIFMGSVNGISSLAGGSIFVPADYNNLAHQQIIDRLQQKMGGCDPKLVVYEGGAQDLDWRVGSNGEHTHLLDIRLLKTLDYLTDRHRIRIDLLKTGAPDIVRDSFLKKQGQYSPTGQDETEQKETLSAFTTGQAMAITEIDRTKIPELQQADVACGVPVPAPIEVRWQRTVSEKTLRPIWEELTYNAGFLDKNVSIYQGVTDRNDEVAIRRVAQAYKLSEPVDGAYDLYKETFRKLPRIVQLIDRALAYGRQNFEGEQAIDPRALAYLQKARENYEPLVAIVEGVNAETSETLLAAKIKLLGEPENIDKLRTGARFAYKATQVKNSVNWDKKRDDGDLTWLKADESRNKQRQVIKELLEMPRETSLDGTPVLFDNNLVIKQIIVFSPEDDLDNGLENLDVFPRGIVAVDTGGVAMDTLTMDADTNNAVGDGEVDYADSHFSHAPIDNGVFSKLGTNYVYKQVRPEDSGWEKAGAFIWTYLTTPGQLMSATDKLHDLMVGGCVANTNETCRKVSYHDFLQVAF